MKKSFITSGTDVLSKCFNVNVLGGGGGQMLNVQSLCPLGMVSTSMRLREDFEE